jgi:SAM-dependent methyltransferase
VAGRAEVIAGALRGAALFEAIEAVPFADREVWIDELLGIEPPPADVDLPRGAVPYLPCGVEEIMAMVREAPLGPDDTLVDVGAGLGRAAILAHLLSAARVLGVEIQAPLVAHARARCAALGIDAVSFVHGDAADVAFDGSVVFLYAPCNGEMFASVMRQIAGLARRRAITVAAVGVELPDARWLAPRPSSCVSLMLYDAPSAGRRDASPRST